MTDKQDIRDDWEWTLIIETDEKGGPGSGHWGHAGRPGQVGGSVSGSIAVSIRTGRTARERQQAAREGRGGAAKPVPAGTKVSGVLDLSGIPGMRSAYGRAVREALDAVDSVHGDGDLPTIPIIKSSGRITQGSYQYIYGTGEAVHIKVSGKGTTESNLLHEVGHFLDHQGLGFRSYESGHAVYGEASPAMQRWFDVAKNSQAVQSLRGILQTGKVKGRTYEGKIQDYNADLQYTRYLQRSTEVFARSYAQYITIRSGNKTLLEQLRKAQAHNRTGAGYPTAWDDDDFAPIAAAFDELFKERGWMK